MGPALAEIGQIQSGIARRETPHGCATGCAVAAAIPGARFVVVDGMGHDLPKPVWRPMIETLTENFALGENR